MKQAFSYLLVFIGIQFAGGAIVRALWNVATGSPDLTPAMLITTTVVVSVITIVVFLWARWTEVSPKWLRTRPWMTLFWSGIAALGAIVPSMWLQELMPELPNWVEGEFDMILANRWGYLVIGLLAPFAEDTVEEKVLELQKRKQAIIQATVGTADAAILKSLLNTQLSPWGAITLSAVLFALIHFNPAQMPHAFLVGLLLGWMYCRTASILPCVAYHWVNNSVAYVLYNLYPNPDMKLADLFQGSQTHVLMVLGFSLLVLVPVIYQLHVWMKRAE